MIAWCRSMLNWVSYTVLGVVAGFALASIPSRHAPAPVAYVWVKVAAGMMCIGFGWLMDKCRKVLAQDWETESKVD